MSEGTQTISGESKAQRRTLQSQVGSYAIARGLPGVVNLLALGLYTRLLGPELFGEYALSLSAISLLSTVGFYWLEIGLVRFFPHASGNDLLPTVLRAFIWAAVIFTTSGLSIAAWGKLKPSLIIAGTTLLLTQAWHGLQLQLARSQLSPSRFARMSIARSTLAPLCGSALILLGFGAEGLLIGLAIGALLPSMGGITTTWLPALRAKPRPDTTRALLTYGAPLSIMFGLRFIVNSSDRFMIAHNLGTESAGIYSAATDLAGNSLGFLTNVVQLAAFPMIVSAFEKRKQKELEQTYQNNMSLLFALTLPAATGLSILAPQIANTFFSDEFSSQTAPLMPWIAAGTLFAMLKTVGFDVAFHLTKRTTLQLAVVLFAAVLNVILNFMLIPRNGILGAAQATLATHILAMVASASLARRLLSLPFPKTTFLRLIAATAFMALCLLPTLHWTGPFELGLQILIGILAFGVSAFALGVPFFRDFLPPSSPQKSQR